MEPIIKRALVSVSDKSGLLELAKNLSRHNVEIISSGGTGAFLKDAGIAYTPIQQVTKNPEAFGGRMKTLSFQVSSALLYRRDHEGDIETAKELEIEAIDLVVCNLYPFEQKVKEGSDWPTLVENIDIGGPTMIRAAAKNHAHVTCVVDPADYPMICEMLNDGSVSVDQDTRKKLAMKTFRHTAGYDSLVARAFEDELELDTKTIHLCGANASELRYGENPHQAGFVYSDPMASGLASTKSLQGKELSYNNFLDADAAFRSCADAFSLDQTKTAISVIKHLNPCGLAMGTDSIKTLTEAWNGDPVSAFGSIICISAEVNLEMAQFFDKRFVELILAPSFSEEALAHFAKKKNLRLLQVDLDAYLNRKEEHMVRAIDGGFVVQREDRHFCEDISMVSENKELADQKDLMNFGMVAGKHLRSNAIALVAQNDDCVRLVGAGMGNPNRLISTMQAIDKFKENGHSSMDGVLLVSDAFFPFRDNIDLANEHGIKLVLQPGGSIRDEEVIAACNEFGMSMATTGYRHFRH